MPVCYFNADYDKKYRCEYEVKKGSIEVVADYEIEDEIAAVNGVRYFGSDMEFKERDILVVDYNSKKNFLLKNAYYAGHRNIFGTPDGGSQTTFRSSIYFVNADLEKLCKLPQTPKFSRIRIHSKAINGLMGYPNLAIESSENEHIIKLSRQKEEKSIAIDANYVKEIGVAEEWKSTYSHKEHNINIDFNGYIEIVLTKRMNYDLAYSFLYELELFMQLYWPDKFSVNHMFVMVDGEYYELPLPETEIRYREKDVEISVKENLLEFLKRCYTAIPYRNSKAEIRNIPYIIMKTSRSLEDNFLMFYRFIECFYKKQSIPDITKKFVSYSIREHYAERYKLSEEQIERYAQEIISLRNHYVHSGYFIKNSSLRISFEKVNKCRNPKDYTVNDVDTRWIYDRAMILYKVVIDIIFCKMLEYKDYNFKKNF